MQNNYATGYNQWICIGETYHDADETVRTEKADINMSHPPPSKPSDLSRRPFKSLPNATQASAIHFHLYLHLHLWCSSSWQPIYFSIFYHLVISIFIYDVEVSVLLCGRDECFISASNNSFACCLFRNWGNLFFFIYIFHKISKIKWDNFKIGCVLWIFLLWYFSWSFLSAI